MELKNKIHIHSARAQGLVLGLVLAAVGCAIAYDLYAEHARMEAREQDRLSLQARVIADNMERQLISVNRALEGALSELPAWEKSPGLEQGFRHLATLYNALPGILSIGVIDAGGTLRISAPSKFIGKNLSYREYFQTVRRHPAAGTLYVSHPFKTLTGTFAINVARMIPGKQGEFNGIVFVNIDPEYFRTLMASVLYAPDMWDGIMHGDGLVFSMMPAREDLNGLNLSWSGSLFARHVYSGLESTVLTGTQDSNDDVRLMAQRTVQPVALNMDKPLIIEVSRNLDAVFLPWRHMFYWEAGFYILFVIAAISGFYFYWRRQRTFDLLQAEAISALQQSELHFRFVSESAQALIWISGTDKRCTWFNKGWLDFTGRTLEQEKGDGWAEGVHPADLPRCLETYVSQFDLRKPFSMEYRLRRHDGEYRWILDKGVPSYDYKGGFIGYIGSCFDITERRRMEEELRESELFFKESQRKASIGSYKVDFATGIWKSSEVLDRIFGIGRRYDRNLEGWLNLVHPDDREMMHRYLQDEVIAKSQPFRKEYRIVHAANGTTRWVLGSGEVDVDASGQIVSMAGTIQDITERKQAEAQLKLAANVFTHVRDGIIITDAEAAIVDVNDAFTRITGFGREEVLGKNPRILKSGRQLPMFYKAMWNELIENGFWSGEVWNRRKNGDVYAEMLSISAVRGPEGKIQNYVGLISDITQTKVHEQQLEHFAHYDVLTDLPNRVLLDDRLSQAILQCQRRGTSLAVIFIDLDGFKAVNDCHGHDMGDELLIAVAQRLKDALRDGDTLSRIGGDEFVAVLVDLTDPGDCEPVLERLLTAASAPVKLGDSTLQVSASMGLALYPQISEEGDQLIRYADQAMYRAKQSGKNRYCRFRL